MKEIKGPIKKIYTAFSVSLAKTFLECCPTEIISNHVNAHKAFRAEGRKKALEAMRYSLYPDHPEFRLPQGAGNVHSELCQSLVLTAVKAIQQDKFSHEGEPPLEKIQYSNVQQDSAAKMGLVIANGNSQATVEGPLIPSSTSNLDPFETCTLSQ